MKLFFSIIGLSVLSFYLAGCGNFNSVYRELKVDEGSGAMVDIKQRAVIASIHETMKEGKAEKKTIVCAEPSPDALSVYAAEIAAEGSVPEKVQAKLSAAFQENAAFVGLRTQSIQLLRDSLYRLCEGYMSGALNELQYQNLFRHYQKYMVALLAIEQLTGTVRPPTVTVSSESLAETVKLIAVKREELSKIEEKISSLEEENNRLKEETPEERQDEIVKKVKSNESISAMDIQSVSNTVKEIVLEILRSDDTRQVCVAFLIESRKRRDSKESKESAEDVQNSETLKMCKEYLENKHIGSTHFLPLLLPPVKSEQPNSPSRPKPR